MPLVIRNIIIDDQPIFVKSYLGPKFRKKTGILSPSVIASDPALAGERGNLPILGIL
jgi:hypothetical protein